MKALQKTSEIIRKAKHNECSVVVVAAGSSTRMGGDKIFMDLCGVPVLARTLRALNRCECVTEIVLVVREDNLELAANLCQDYGMEKVTKVVCGGKSRTESALAGLSEIDSKAKYVLIHDGARPLVTEEVVNAALHGAAVYGCAVPAVPVTDTVKEAEKGAVLQTPDRSRLFAVQTPQAFDADLIRTALTVAVRDGKEFTDDSAAAEALGAKVHLTEGSVENIKLTRPVDRLMAAAILKSRGE